MRTVERKKFDDRIKIRPIMFFPDLVALAKRRNNFDIILLYSLYQERVSYQNTDKPQCNEYYVMKYFGWGKNRVRKAKKILVEEDWVANFKRRNKQGGIEGHYIKVKRLATEETLKKYMKANEIFIENEMDNGFFKKEKIKKESSIPFLNLFPKEFQESSEFQETWIEWLNHRKEIKQPLNYSGAKLQVTKATKKGISISDVVFAIEVARDKRYRSFFPEPSKNKKYNRNYKSSVILNKKEVPRDDGNDAELFEMMKQKYKKQE